MARRRKLLTVAAVVLPALAYIGWAGYVRFGGSAVQRNTLVGRTEPQLLASYGRPDGDRQGYHSLARYVPPALPPGPIRTLFYPRGLLHPEGGTLWVWLVERDGVWVCFESCWFADGVKL